MGKFVVEPHFRLQEWVAEEKGYFRAEGLEYEFRELIRSTAGQHHNKVNQGAFQSIERGREADVSCACHWTVNVAASAGHAKLYADLYSIAPSGIFVPSDSRYERRPIWQVCRCRSASSPGATIRRYRHSNSTCPPATSS